MSARPKTSREERKPTERGASEGEKKKSPASRPRYNAPETRDAALIQSNLRALFRMDAWSTGVLVCMVLSRTDASPFDAGADWRLGLFSDRDAVAARTATTRRRARAGEWEHLGG